MIFAAVCAQRSRASCSGLRKPVRDARGLQIRCKKTVAARFLVPKKPHIPYWGAHTYVETLEHAVDAVTGPDGYEAASYVNDHWHWNDRLYEKVEIDVATVDPGIEDIGAGS